MKKPVFLIVAVIFTLNVANAQQKTDSLNSTKNGLKISAGLVFLPCGSVSLYSFEKLFSGIKTDAPIYAIVSLKKGNLSINPYYLMTNNSFGGFIDYSFPSLTLFVVGSKETKTSNISVGTGVFIPFIKGQGPSMLLEIKSPLKKWDPSFVVGILLPFTFKLKK